MEGECRGRREDMTNLLMNEYMKGFWGMFGFCGTNEEYLNRNQLLFYFRMHFPPYYNELRITDIHRQWKWSFSLSMNIINS